MSSDLDPSAPRSNEPTPGSHLDRAQHIDTVFLTDGLSEFAEEPVVQTAP